MTCRECAKFKKCGGKLGATKYYDAVLAVGNVEKKCADFYPKESVKASVDAYDFPVRVGDTVKCVVEDENRVTDILEYTVHGLAVFNGKKYVITKDGQINEIGTADCILPCGG